MKRVLVTGGGGFVGTALVRRLIEKDCSVTVASRNRYEHIEQLGASCLVGDISNQDFAAQICRGMDTVFHVAAKAGIWGSWQEFRTINIVGTSNIVESCHRNEVGCLVYTSTPSVVYAGGDIVNGDETLPYAGKFFCHYAKSKVAAERQVLANSGERLRTCAIRPHLIWGPGDPHLLPRLIERGRSGKLKIIGNGANKVDITYVDNVAHAHILAAESLHKSSRFSGQAYFIGQEAPVNLWDWINELYRDLGIEPVVKKVPFRTAYLAGLVLELLHRLPMVRSEPQMTRFLAMQLAHSHCFSHKKAEEEIGYVPIISLEEGKKRLLESITR